MAQNTKSRSSKKASSSARKSASKKTSTSRSSARQTQKTASDNAITATNEIANAQAEAHAAKLEALPEKLATVLQPPKEGEAITSLNNLPKEEGGLPADVIAGMRSSIASAVGDAALGQPGQLGHGVGTADLRDLTDDEIEADQKEYARRFGGKA